MVPLAMLLMEPQSLSLVVPQSVLRIMHQSASTSRLVLRSSTSVQLMDGSLSAVQRACVAAQRTSRPPTPVWNPDSAPGNRPRVFRRAIEEPATVRAMVLGRAVSHGGSRIFCSFWSAMTPLLTPRSPTAKTTEEQSHLVLASDANWGTRVAPPHGPPVPGVAMQGMIPSLPPSSPACPQSGLDKEPVLETSPA